jgi:hypothetical protein
MKLAIMQPYFLPYIGYFQLINAVDKFVILDDVNYINRGWINRNRILVNNKDLMITIPLKEASQNKLILDSYISDDEKWQSKILKTIEMTYKKTSQFKQVFPLIEKIIQYSDKNIANFNLNSIEQINRYLGINTEIIPSSKIYNNGNLKGQDRILDICIKEKADFYINPIGGSELYQKEVFKLHNIDLAFLKCLPIEYKQHNCLFISCLSVIDVLMFNTIDETHHLLNKFDLL